VLTNGDSHILLDLECTTPNSPVYLFAYTTGIIGKTNYMGEEHDFIDYCKLRDSKVAPELWAEKYNIPEYVYYTLILE